MTAEAQGNRVAPAMVPSAESPLTGPFEPLGGSAWSVAIPPSLTDLPGNCSERYSRSPLVLFENGCPLGRRHQELVDIQATGGGAHNHWYGSLLFSTSDNSDPNTNGRSYELRMVDSVPLMIAFGSCHMGALMRGAAGRGEADVVAHYALTYNTDEVIQLVDQIRGRLTIPAELQPYIGGAGPLAGSGILDDVCFKFVEVCNNIRLQFRGFSLNRVMVVDAIVKPAQALGPTVAKAAMQWFDAGVHKRDDAVRASANEILLAAFAGDDAINATRRDVLKELRAVEQSEEEIRSGLGTILDSVPGKTCLAVHTLRYMPDGRPIRWPAGFHARVHSLGKELGLPVLDAGAMVEKLGGAFALTEDLEHHTPAFNEYFSRAGMELMMSEPSTAPAS